MLYRQQQLRILSQTKNISHILLLVARQAVVIMRIGTLFVVICYNVLYFVNRNYKRKSRYHEVRCFKFPAAFLLVIFCLSEAFQWSKKVCRKHFSDQSQQ